MNFHKSYNTAIVIYYLVRYTVYRILRLIFAIEIARNLALTVQILMVPTYASAWPGSRLSLSAEKSSDAPTSTSAKSTSTNAAPTPFAPTLSEGTVALA